MTSDQKSSRQAMIMRRVDPAELGIEVASSTDIADMRSALVHAAAAGCNVLAPITTLQRIPPMHEMGITVVAFSTAGMGPKGNSTWYTTDGGGLALRRAAIDQLAQAAGLSSVPSGCCVEQVDRGTYKATHTVRGKGLDGTERVVVASATAGGGKYADRKAETMAHNRCVRRFLAIKGSYTKEEAVRPFVLAKVTFAPDMTNPVIAEMVAAKELGIVGEIYGARAAAQRPGQIAEAEIAEVDADDTPEPWGAK